MDKRTEPSRVEEVELVAATSAADVPEWMLASGETLASLGVGGLARRPPLLRTLLLGVWIVCGLALAPLWVLCALVERLAHGRVAVRSKILAWRFVHIAWDDAIVSVCALLPKSYGRTVWSFPPELASAKCALTIDDAPGRDPAALCELLDALRDNDAKATFFVTTDYAECLADDAASSRMAPQAKAEWCAAVRAALRRMVNEGHELAHHMPADRPYARQCTDDENGFRAEFARAERVLGAIVADATADASTADALAAAPAGDDLAPVPPARGTLGRWFRPPSAALTPRMAQIVRGLGYRIALCDAYSADPWIDGGGAPSAHACRFHARWLGTTMRSGSIAVLHTPERAARRQTLEAVRQLLPALQAKGLRAVTLTELADEVLDNHMRAQLNGANQELKLR